MLRRLGRPIGYIVLRFADEAELPGGVIVDMFADPGDTEALDGLVSFATERLGAACEYIEAAASTPAYYRALLRAGFVAVRTMRPTVVCDVPGLAETIVALKDRWHFTKADHDWDQIHPV
jgi:hypothetical protein